MTVSLRPRPRIVDASGGTRGGENSGRTRFRPSPSLPPLLALDDRRDPLPPRQWLGFVLHLGPPGSPVGPVRLAGTRPAQGLVPDRTEHMLLALPLTDDELPCGRRRDGRGRGRGSHRRRKLLDEPVAQEPNSGPHAALGQPADQRPPQIRSTHTAPNPLGSDLGQPPRLTDPEVQLRIRVPKREQHPLAFGDFGRLELSEPFGRIGLFELFELFGGWVGVVLPKFFIYRFIATDRPAPRLTDGRIPRTRAGG
ncbi:hypothetical protein [Streptomyces sp. NPDC001880]